MRSITILVLLAILSPIISPSFCRAEDVLLQRNQFVYQGAFRVPRGNLGGEDVRGNTLSFATGRLGFRPATVGHPNGTLLISTKESAIVAEISIPTPLKTATIAGLNTAVSVRPPIDPTSGTKNNFGANGEYISTGSVAGGYLVSGSKIVSVQSAYYNAGAFLSHFSFNSDWSVESKGFSGLKSLTADGTTALNVNLTGSLLTPVPQAKRAIIGYDTLSGMGGASATSSSSMGPCSFGFNASDVTDTSLIPSKMLLCYPDGHNTLGQYGNWAPQSLYSQATKFKGAVWPAGTKTMLYFGRMGLGNRGLGDSGYGGAELHLGDIAASAACTAASAGTDPENRCSIGCIPGFPDLPCQYDPVDTSVKGPHGYPYVHRVWVYNTDYMEKVATGEIIQASELPDLIDGSVAGQVYQPWNLKPYALWDLSSWTIDPYVSYTLNPPTQPNDIPFPTVQAEIDGAAYDPSTGKIYITQGGDADLVGLEPFPLVHVFQVDVALPVDDIAPTTTGSIATGSAQNVTLMANEPATIRYTTNGSTPTITSPVYSAPISVSSTTTIKFFAIDTAGNNEAVKTAVYTIGAVIVPTTTPSKAPGRYLTTQQLSLTASAGTAKYCFGAGCTPAPYTAPFKILQNLARQTVRVQSVDGANVGAVQTLEFRKQRRR